METVIVYRCTPKNKRDLVRLVQEHPIFDNPITAAIGDGSNDTSMLL
jgi:P-type E1-E2 ATPase